MRGMLPGGGVSSLRFRAAVAAGCLCVLGVVRAAQADPDVLRQLQEDLAAKHPKTIALVMDVSGSMSEDGRLRKARKSALWIVRNVVGEGDRVLVYPFSGAFEKSVDRVVRTSADRKSVVEAIPYQASQGKGTNIRQAHHRALGECIDAVPDAAVVLVTDSYNDQPDANGRDGENYRKYYIPGARLDRFPDTPENRDYERLLTEFRRKGGRTYGLGVEIDPSTGRPLERLPQELPSAAITAPPAASARSARPLRRETIPAGALIATGLVALGGVLLVTAWRRPLALRLDGGGLADPEFSLSPGREIRLGGEAGFANRDAVPIAGTRATVGSIRMRGRRLELIVKPAEGVRVQLNGLGVEHGQSLRDNDEIRVVVDGEDGVLPRETRYRLVLTRAGRGGGVDA